MDILTFTHFYLPGYKAGGPIQSVANLVAHLGEEFNFRIVTQDRDSGDDAPYPGVVQGEWQWVNNGEVCYLAPEQQTLSRLAKVMRDTPHDVLYLNSFFGVFSTTLPLLARRLGMAPRCPVIIAPRGEFSRGALAIKAKKKRLFFALARLLGLHRNVLWQASSEHEERDIRRMFGPSACIHVASDLPRKVPPHVAHPSRPPGAPLRVLFLSRISPMKNLEFLLDVLRRVSVPIDCTIIGSVAAPDYWDACQAQIAILPSHITVRYHGAVPAQQVPDQMSQHDLLFLPTRGENFGHVIIEALAAGTPALISDKTPWQDLETQGAGWVYPLDGAERFVATIERLYHECPADAAARRREALAYARRFTENDTLLMSNRALFTSRRLVSRHDPSQ